MGRTTSELARRAAEAFTQGTDLVEFRIDLLRSPRFEDIRADLSRFKARAVFAVRPRAEGGGFRGGEPERLTLLRRIRQLTPAYLDIELRTAEANQDVASHEAAGGIIVSWHDMSGAGEERELRSVMNKAASFGGLAKIVTTATDPADNLTILSLYGRHSPAPIAFCMGAHGLLSRVMAMELGSPIAYASLPGEQTASGQLPLGLVLALRRRLENA